MDGETKITFAECDEIKCVDVWSCIDDEGQILRVPVYLYDVCPCSKIIVGVRIYVDGKLYAMQTKKVRTGRSPHCQKMNDFYVGEFLFLFQTKERAEIDIRALAHYIY